MVKYSLFCIDKNVSVLFEFPDALVTRVWARIYAEPERTGGRATDRPTDQLADDDEKGRHDEDSDRRPFKQISLCPRKPTPPPRLSHALFSGYQLGRAEAGSGRRASPLSSSSSSSSVLPPFFCRVRRGREKSHVCSPPPPPPPPP